ncbi:cyclohexanone monooxygenase [Xylogone sp. PMI_703]|nr:cyclohexanone monooxygenase [Xylogone sp. PMI_703]
MAKADAIKYFQDLARANSDPTAITEGYKNRDDLAYYMSQVPFKSARPLKVIVAGCGISGLSFAHEVHDGGKLQNIDLVIYEKNPGVGGTWHENRYPGCACDIPVHNYQFDWAPYPYFSSYYAGSEEIREYLEDVAEQHHLAQYVRLLHKVAGALWHEDRSKWEVKVERLDDSGNVVSSFVEECDVFISATGYVNDWKWPNIPARNEFKGRMFHSAAWPRESVSFEGETVALIGNGSSGIQILPAILGQAKKVYVFMRSPTWITAGFASKYAGPGGSNIIFSEEQKQQWTSNPDEYFKYRKAVEGELNNSFRIYLKDSAEQQNAKNFAVNQMSAKLASKPEILKLLLPDFAVGCRRPTPGHGYLEALCSDKVDVIWGEIDSFTSTGLQSSSGREVEVDSIICATGFNVAFTPRFDVVGRNNTNLRTKWTKNPQAYLSVTATDMPNYFVYLGPASAVGHGSIVPSIEMVTGYISNMLYKLQTQNYGSLCPKADVVEAWQQHALLWLEKSAWATPCVISLHAGSRLHYFELLQEPRYEDFEWKSLCEDPMLKFAWLASGFTQGEAERQKAKAKGLESKVDLTWFVHPADPKAFIRRHGRKWS